MKTVYDIINFCNANGLFYRVNYDTISCGGTVENDVDMTGYRVDQSVKCIVGEVYYPQYDLRFDPKTKEVKFREYKESEKMFDIRQHPAWEM